MTAPPRREIRADFDRDSLVVYQAYPDAIADAALAAGAFVPPFSFGRMTWIKPSFLWLMERSNWGRKANQERILAVRVHRAAWDEALALAVLTNFEPRVHGDASRWRRAFERATVHVQWDTDRTLRGGSREVEAIQVGIGRALVRAYAEQWIVSIRDLTPLVRKLRRLCDEGRHARAQDELPPERPYPVDDENLRRRLGMLI